MPDRAVYILLWLLTAAWVWSFARVILDGGRVALITRVRQNAADAALSLLAAAAVFILITPDLRVLSDEAILLATSRALADGGRLDYLIEGYQRSGVFVPINANSDIRPFGFPFAVHILHLVTGTRTANIFAVNFLALAGSLWLILRILKPWIGPLWSATAALALLSQPILLQCATSGGFEFFQLFWVLASIAAFLHHLDDPASEKRFRLLWASLIALSHVRYESVLFMITVIIALLAARRFPHRFLRSWFYPVSILLLVPLIRQWSLALSYHPNSLPAGTPLWTAANAATNITQYAATLVRPQMDWPYNFILNGVGTVTIALSAWFYFRGTWRPDRQIKLLLLSFGSALALIVLGLAAYAESGLHLPQSSRYFLLGSAALSIAAVLGLRRLLRQRSAPYILAGCAALFFLFLPTARGTSFWDSNFTNAEYRFATGAVRELGMRPGDAILVAQRPVIYLSKGFESLSFIRLRGDSGLAGTALGDGLSHRRVLAIQEFSEGKVSDSTRISPIIGTRTLARSKELSGRRWELNELIF